METLRSLGSASRVLVLASLLACSSSSSSSSSSAEGGAPPADGGVEGTDASAPSDASSSTDAQALSWKTKTSGVIEDLHAVFGVSGVVLAVGAGGTIVRSADDGATWERRTSGTTQALNAIWGTANDLTAVGDNVVLHSSDAGLTWSVVPNLNNLWKGAHGLPSGARWIVGYGGSNVAMATGANGSGLQLFTTGGKIAAVGNAVWMGAQDDIYVATGFSHTGAMYHGTGDGAWVSQDTQSHAFYAVWGSSRTDVYAVGEGGMMRHSSGGGAWQPLVGGTTSSLYSVWGSSAADVFVVGGEGTILHTSDGATFVRQPSNVTITLRAVWGFDASNVFAVGQQGTILHRE